ncbi:Neurotransmitter-gated ion-channel transmembrane domain [Trichostrongylus colubriformis]|uniref:Neurotransmitter-gated ion-channel transmembrane domain n=1 Tax=Trichostrongylus colubriformis TaxID=6319 RepID=A0AAN8G2U2_TRICO
MLAPHRADVRLYSNGAIKVNIPQYVSAICRIQTQSFPFDCQFCAVALASPLLNVDEMIVNATPPPKDSYFAGNAEWLLFNVTVRHMTFVEEGESRVEVHYIFHLQRRPIYYITVIVAPTFLISALSILGIFSPGSSDGPRNEKVSLGLGSLLAMTVLLGIVAGAMPKSNSIPLLGYYILIVILLCAIAVSISMAFLGISRHYIQKDQMPSKRILRWMFIPDHRKRRSNSTSRNSSYTSHMDKERPKIPELALIYNILVEIADSHRNLRRKTDQKIQRKAVQHEWARVFSRFDYFFLFVFELLNMVALAIFLRVAWLPTPELRDQIL